ncbi:hypothetical protein ACQV2T_08405 [Facklamia sp. P13069]|uniref:hypothetical protein n=1 Tax=Facklamia sp. P13069 TaxID=3421954 RepID=UPI003D170B83
MEKNIQLLNETASSSIFFKYRAILDRIKTDLKFSLDREKVKEEILDLLLEVKENRVSRISYVPITNYVYKLDQEFREPLTYLITNMVDVLQSIINGEESSECDIDEDTLMCVVRMVEHTELANSQRSVLFDSTEEKLKVAHLEIKKYKKDIEQLKEVSDQLSKKHANLTTEIISVLGIFSSLIFAVFGGVSQLGELGGALSSTPLHKVFIFTGSSSIVLLGIVFIAFNATAKMTKKNIRSCCNNENCNHSLIEKHPTFFFLMWLFLSMIAIGLLFYLVESKNLYISTQILKIPWSLKYIGIFFLIISPILSLLYIFWQEHKKKRNR